MSVGERIKELRLRLGMSQVAFADAIGVSKQTLYKYENNIITNIPSDKIEAAAKIGNVSPAYLMGWATTQDITHLPKNLVRLDTVKYIPLLGKIACGDPILAEENIVDRILLPSHVNATFALFCEGDSMTGAGVEDGDIIFIREQPQVENGEIAAVLINDSATLKKVYLDDNKLSLLPMNPTHDPFVFVGEEMSNIRIIGKAVAVLKNLE